MNYSLIYLNLTTLGLSVISIISSIVLDVKYWKTSGLTTPNGIIGLIMRISSLLWCVQVVAVLFKAEKFVTESKSLVEQRMGITVDLCAAQVFVTLNVMCIFASFIYYWISVATMLPISKLLGKTKKLIDKHPLMVPIGLLVYYLIYLACFFGPLLVWKGQLLRYSYWRVLIQAMVQILLGLFLLPVLIYLINALYRFITAKDASQDSANDELVRKVTMALIRMILTNMMLIVFMIMAPATNLVLDRTLLFEEIQITHPIYSQSATTMFTSTQSIVNLTGFFISLLFWGSTPQEKR
ncbi:hypothetical protein HDV02_002868 [Globomyces sp. JEL0801]|nr:hypothetical protein HDV02_002868 [Globomyces sp. JEL0801]